MSDNTVVIFFRQYSIINADWDYKSSFVSKFSKWFNFHETGLKLMKDHGSVMIVVI